MATVSFVAGGTGSGYIAATDQNIVLSESSFEWTPPTFTTYFAGLAGARSLRYGGNPYRIGSYSGYLYSGASAYTASGAWSGPVSFTNKRTLQTSQLFNSNNPTERTVVGSITINANEVLDCNNGQTMYAAFNNVAQTLALINITLDAPPTFDNTALTFDTPYVYTGLTNASVTVSNLSAKYGGTITDVTLTIGTQTDSATGDGTLSVLLDTVGTFTPTITATDSRGQTTTVTLDPIEVKGYTAPAVTFTADRTLQTGVEDDEGGYATVDATFTYTDVVADLVAPSVVLTDENGTQTTPTVTWYKTRATDGTLSSPFTDWTTVAYGDTVYGLIPGLSTQYSYQVSIRPRDTQGTGTAIIQTIAPAFYTVDFLAGGHGIAFGKPASDVGFFCNMDAHFVDANSVMRALFDFVYPVGSYYETSDTAFDPNTTWGGTWVLETAGQVHISAGTSTTSTVFTVNGANANSGVGMSDGGEEKHWLTMDEMPTHNHGYYYTNSGAGVKSLAWWSASGNGLSYDLVNTGGNQTHNNMQPYIVVNRWHRTA